MLWLAMWLQDGAAVLEKSAAAFQKHDAAAIVVQMRFSDAESLPFRFEGTLGKEDRLRLEQKRGNEITLTVADDKYIWIHESRTNQYVRAPKPKRGLTLGKTGLNVIAQAFYDPDFAKSTLRGATDVKVSADGLTVSWKAQRQDWTCTIDGTTKLPKRVTNATKDLTITCEVQQIDVKVKTDDATFAFKMPAGATQRTLGEPLAGRPGLPAADFTLDALDGGTDGLKAHKDKVVLIVFWHADDPESREEIGALNGFAAKYPELVILAIDRGDTEKRLKGIVKGAKFAVLHADGKTEPIDDVAAKYGVIGYPTTTLVGRNGKVVEKWTDFDEAAIRKALEAACK